MLTEEMKQNRVDICHQHLLRYDWEKENRLNIIVTGDESWVHIIMTLKTETVNRVLS